MKRILWFDDPDSGSKVLVGGKGANLGLLTHAGFSPPCGFVVTTDGYTEFLATDGLERRLAEMVASLEFDGPEDLEARTAEIRELIRQTPIASKLTADIVLAYQKLGADAFVAVRSSGTAEDLDEASFAGMHDTYLEVIGEDRLLVAIRGCWASLWTARAVNYRHTQGINQLQARMGVVVQTMVQPEVSGVMFTGNPLTTATNEIVINASWGLGESIVGGLVTPDAYVVEAGTRRVKDQVPGTKAIRIVRDRIAGAGVVTEPVGDSDQKRLTLSEPQLADLAALGERIQAYYEGIPQDIEWALVDGEFVLLQSRPITGVDFTWDEHLEVWQTIDDDEDIFWTRELADQFWTGPVSPFMYSLRAWSIHASYSMVGQQAGIQEMTNRRIMKYYKGTAYYNVDIEKFLQQRTLLPPFRHPNSMALSMLPEALHAETVDVPFSYLDYLKLHARLRLVWPQCTLYRWYKTLGTWIDDFTEMHIDKLPDPTRLSDADLKRHIDQCVCLERDYATDVLLPILVFVRDAHLLLQLITTNWYDGDNPMVFGHLLAGSRMRTRTFEENFTLHALAEEIRNSKELSSLFEQYEGGSFFTALEGSSEGEAFLAKYRQFLTTHGHRGSDDRDLLFPRRFEDPAIDYRNFKIFLSNEVTHPEAAEESVNQLRETAYEDVLHNLQKKPLGFLKAEVFKLVYDYLQTWVVHRDNERWAYERNSYNTKIFGREMGRRLRERGLIKHADDFFYLGREENYALLDGHGNPTLTKAKIASRRRLIDRMMQNQWTPPRYLQRGQSISLDAASDDSALRGKGMSPGTVTATARIVARLNDIGRVQQGDILVCANTDPGWTPVFALLNGIVTESGGMLAHAACLSREYGIPAVQITDAMRLIPDGATITISGDTGDITVVEESTATAVG